MEDQIFGDLRAGHTALVPFRCVRVGVNPCGCAETKRVRTSGDESRNKTKYATRIAEEKRKEYIDIYKKGNTHTHTEKKA